MGSGRYPGGMKRSVLLLFVVGFTVACGGASSDGSPPVIWLSFEGDLANRGTAALDLHTEGDEVSFAEGVDGQAVFIGGSEDWIEGPVPEGLDLGRGGTLELWVMRDDWVNPYGGGSGGQTFATIDALILDISVLSGRDPDRNRLRGTAQSPGFETHQATSERSLPALEWTHLAVVYDGAAGDAILYVDGEEAARQPGVPQLTTSYPNPFKIGTWYQQNQAFRGWIDEVRVFDYARSAAQIAESARLTR